VVRTPSESPRGGPARSAPTVSVGGSHDRQLFRREGEYWTVSYGDTAVRLRDTKGLHYIAHLLRHPGQEVHVADLATLAADDAGERGRRRMESDLGAVLDPRATAEYKRRLADLREELDAATAAGDIGRATSVRHEIEVITRELSAAYGLGSRARKTGDHGERLRKRSRIRSVARSRKSTPRTRRSAGTSRTVCGPG